MITLPPIGLSKLKGRWPVFRSVASQLDSSGSNSLFVTKPAGVASGDILLAFIYSRNTNSLSSFDGFSLHTSATPTLDGVAHHCKSFIKIATGSEPADYEWFWDTPSQGKGGVVLAYTGGHATQTENANNVVLSANFQTHTMPTLVPSFDYSMQVSCWFLDATGTGVIGTVTTPPVGMTLRFASPDAGFGGNAPDFFTVYEQRLGLNAVGSGTRDLVSGNNCSSFGITAGIRRS